MFQWWRAEDRVVRLPVPDGRARVAGVYAAADAVLVAGGTGDLFLWPSNQPAWQRLPVDGGPLAPAPSPTAPTAIDVAFCDHAMHGRCCQIAQAHLSSPELLVLRQLCVRLGPQPDGPAMAEPQWMNSERRLDDLARGLAGCCQPDAMILRWDPQGHMLALAVNSDCMVESAIVFCTDNLCKAAVVRLGAGRSDRAARACAHSIADMAWAHSGLLLLSISRAGDLVVCTRAGQPMMTTASGASCQYGPSVFLPLFSELPPMRGRSFWRKQSSRAPARAEANSGAISGAGYFIETNPHNERFVVGNGHVFIVARSPQGLSCDGLVRMLLFDASPCVDTDFVARTGSPDLDRPAVSHLLHAWRLVAADPSGVLGWCDGMRDAVGKLVARFAEPQVPGVPPRSAGYGDALMAILQHCLSCLHLVPANHHIMAPLLRLILALFDKLLASGDLRAAMRLLTLAEAHLAQLSTQMYLTQVDRPVALVAAAAPQSASCMRAAPIHLNGLWKALVHHCWMQANRATTEPDVDTALCTAIGLAAQRTLRIRHAASRSRCASSVTGAASLATADTLFLRGEYEHAVAAYAESPLVAALPRLVALLLFRADLRSALQSVYRLVVARSDARIDWDKPHLLPVFADPHLNLHGITWPLLWVRSRAMCHADADSDAGDDEGADATAFAAASVALVASLMAAYFRPDAGDTFYLPSPVALSAVDATVPSAATSMETLHRSGLACSRASIDRALCEGTIGTAEWTPQRAVELFLLARQPHGAITLTRAIGDWKYAVLYVHAFGPYLAGDSATLLRSVMTDAMEDAIRRGDTEAVLDIVLACAMVGDGVLLVQWLRDVGAEVRAHAAQLVPMVPDGVRLPHAEPFLPQTPCDAEGPTDADRGRTADAVTQQELAVRARLATLVHRQILLLNAGGLLMPLLADYGQQLLQVQAASGGADESPPVQSTPMRLSHVIATATTPKSGRAGTPNEAHDEFAVPLFGSTHTMAARDVLRELCHCLWYVRVRDAAAWSARQLRRRRAASSGAEHARTDSRVGHANGEIDDVQRVERAAYEAAVWHVRLCYFADLRGPAELVEAAVWALSQLERSDVRIAHLLASPAVQAAERVSRDAELAVAMLVQQLQRDAPGVASIYQQLARKGQAEQQWSQPLQLRDSSRVKPLIPYDLRDEAYYDFMESLVEAVSEVPIPTARPPPWMRHDVPGTPALRSPRLAAASPDLRYRNRHRRRGPDYLLECLHDWITSAPPPGERARILMQDLGLNGSAVAPGPERPRLSGAVSLAMLMNARWLLGHRPAAISTVRDDAADPSARSMVTPVLRHRRTAWSVDGMTDDVSSPVVRPAAVRESHFRDPLLQAVLTARAAGRTPGPLGSPSAWNRSAYHAVGLDQGGEWSAGAGGARNESYAVALGKRNGSAGGAVLASPLCTPLAAGTGADRTGQARGMLDSALATRPVPSMELPSPIPHMRSLDSSPVLRDASMVSPEAVASEAHEPAGVYEARTDDDRSVCETPASTEHASTEPVPSDDRVSYLERSLVSAIPTELEDGQAAFSTKDHDRPLDGKWTSSAALPSPATLHLSTLEPERGRLDDQTCGSHDEHQIPATLPRGRIQHAFALPSSLRPDESISAKSDQGADRAHLSHSAASASVVHAAGLAELSLLPNLDASIASMMDAARSHETGRSVRETAIADSQCDVSGSHRLSASPTAADTLSSDGAENRRNGSVSESRRASCSDGRLELEPNACLAEHTEPAPSPFSITATQTHSVSNRSALDSARHDPAVPPRLDAERAGPGCDLFLDLPATVALDDARACEAERMTEPAQHTVAAAVAAAALPAAAVPLEAVSQQSSRDRANEAAPANLADAAPTSMPLSAPLAAQHDAELERERTAIETGPNAMDTSGPDAANIVSTAVAAAVDGAVGIADRTESIDAGQCTSRLQQPTDSPKISVMPSLFSSDAAVVPPEIANVEHHTPVAVARTVTACDTDETTGEPTSTSMCASLVSIDSWCSAVEFAAGDMTKGSSEEVAPRTADQSGVATPDRTDPNAWRSPLCDADSKEPCVHVAAAAQSPVVGPRLRGRADRSSDQCGCADNDSVGAEEHLSRADPLAPSSAMRAVFPSSLMDSSAQHHGSSDVLAWSDADRQLSVSRASLFASVDETHSANAESAVAVMQSEEDRVSATDRASVADVDPHGERGSTKHDALDCNDTRTSVRTDNISPTSNRTAAREAVARETDQGALITVEVAVTNAIVDSEVAAAAADPARTLVPSDAVESDDALRISMIDEKPSDGEASTVLHGVVVDAIVADAVAMVEAHSGQHIATPSVDPAAAMEGSHAFIDGMPMDTVNDSRIQRAQDVIHPDGMSAVSPLYGAPTPLAGARGDATTCYAAQNSPHVHAAEQILRVGDHERDPDATLSMADGESDAECTQVEEHRPNTDPTETPSAVCDGRDHDTRMECMHQSRSPSVRSHSLSGVSVNRDVSSLSPDAADRDLLQETSRGATIKDGSNASALSGSLEWLLREGPHCEPAGESGIAMQQQTPRPADAAYPRSDAAGFESPSARDWHTTDAGQDACAGLRGDCTTPVVTGSEQSSTFDVSIVTAHTSSTAEAWPMPLGDSGPVEIVVEMDCQPDAPTATTHSAILDTDASMVAAEDVTTSSTTAQSPAHLALESSMHAMPCTEQRASYVSTVVPESVRDLSGMRSPATSLHEDPDSTHAAVATMNWVAADLLASTDRSSTLITAAAMDADPSSKAEVTVHDLRRTSTPACDERSGSQSALGFASETEAISTATLEPGWPLACPTDQSVSAACGPVAADLSTISSSSPEPRVHPLAQSCADDGRGDGVAVNRGPGVPDAELAVGDLSETTVTEGESATLNATVGLMGPATVVNAPQTHCDLTDTGASEDESRDIPPFAHVTPELSRTNQDGSVLLSVGGEGTSVNDRLPLVYCGTVQSSSAGQRTEDVRLSSPHAHDGAMLGSANMQTETQRSAFGDASPPSAASSVDTADSVGARADRMHSVPDSLLPADTEHLLPAQDRGAQTTEEPPGPVSLGHTVNVIGAVSRALHETEDYSGRVADADGTMNAADSVMDSRTGRVDHALLDHPLSASLAQTTELGHQLTGDRAIAQAAVEARSGVISATTAAGSEHPDARLRLTCASDIAEAPGTLAEAEAPSAPWSDVSLPDAIRSRGSHESPVCSSVVMHDAATSVNGITPGDSRDDVSARPLATRDAATECTPVEQISVAVSACDAVPGRHRLNASTVESSASTITPDTRTPTIAHGPLSSVRSRNDALSEGAVQSPAAGQIAAPAMVADRSVRHRFEKAPTTDPVQRLRARESPTRRGESRPRLRAQRPSGLAAVLLADTDSDESDGEAERIAQLDLTEADLISADAVRRERRWRAACGLPVTTTTYAPLAAQGAAAACRWPPHGGASMRARSTSHVQLGASASSDLVSLSRTRVTVTASQRGAPAAARNRRRQPREVSVGHDAGPAASAPTPSASDRSAGKRDWSVRRNHAAAPSERPLDASPTAEMPPQPGAVSSPSTGAAASAASTRPDTPPSADAHVTLRSARGRVKHGPPVGPD